MSASEQSPAQIEHLERQVATLQQELADRPRRHWVRTFWSTVLIVVACILAPLSVVSVWARGEVTDTSRYVETVTPLASDPAVQNAVANRITTEIFTYVDVPALTQEAVSTIVANRDLTDRQTAALEALVGPVSSGIESYTNSAVDAVVKSDAFESAWVEANTLVHQRLNEALSGQNAGGAVELQDGQVVLDLGNLVSQVKQRLIDRGFTIAERIPATTQTSIALFDAPNAAAAQTAYSVLNTVGFWLPLIAIALAVIGIFVCHTPRKALTWLGFGLLLAMGVAAVALGVARISYLNALPDTVDQAAATAFFDAFTRFLVQALWAGAAAGAVLFLGGLLLSPGRFATGVRRVPVGAAGGIQRWLASLGLHMDAARNWVSTQATALRVGAALIALVFVMLQRYKTPGLVLWTTVVLLAVLFVIQIFASGEDEAPAVGEEQTAPTTVL